MGAGRWGALCLMATVGCRGEPAAWNPCEPQPQVTLGRAGASLSAPFVLGDETGFVVFWGGEVVEADPGTAGVFAARRDSGRVTLVPGVNAQILSSVVVEGGYLVCWADGAGRADELDRGGCGVVDRHLEWLRPDARPSFGIVLALGRIGGHLHALVDDGAINTDHHALIPLDETGDAVGAPVDWPCTGGWADSGSMAAARSRDWRRTNTASPSPGRTTAARSECGSSRTTAPWDRGRRSRLRNP